MLDGEIEDLVEPIHGALRRLSEDQLTDLGDALHRLQIALDEELLRREHGDEEDDAGDDEPW